CTTLRMMLPIAAAVSGGTRDGSTPAARRKPSQSNASPGVLAGARGAGGVARGAATAALVGAARAPGFACCAGGAGRAGCAARGGCAGGGGAGGGATCAGAGGRSFD